jgi:hypothetical protein
MPSNETPYLGTKLCQNVHPVKVPTRQIVDIIKCRPHIGLFFLVMITAFHGRFSG